MDAEQILTEAESDRDPAIRQRAASLRSRMAELDVELDQRAEGQREAAERRLRGV